MAIWGETGKRHGLTADAGTLLGTPTAGVADIVGATLWSTMAAHLTVIGELLDDQAPLTAALVRRVCAEPSVVDLAAVSRAQFGDRCCGGEIEQSMKRAIR